MSILDKLGFWRRKTVRRSYFLLGEGLALTRLSNGQYIYVDPLEESVCAHLIAKGVWEPNTHAVLLSLIASGDHVLEVGCHVGVHTIDMARKVGPSGSLTAFEANPRLARLAARSLRFNGLHGQARIINKAASDTAGPVRFTTSRSFAGGGHLYIGEGMLGDDVEVIEVEAVRLDDLGLTAPRLFKIDAEGAEALILKGAARLLERPDIVLCLEWDRFQMASRSDPGALARWLRERGFLFWRIDGQGRLIPVGVEELDAAPVCEVIVARADPLPQGRRPEA